MIVAGNKGLLDSKLAVVLNSSQSKTPCGNDTWIKQTAQVIPQIINDGHTIITSIGISTWEMATYLTGICGGNQIIISLDFDGEDGATIYDRTIGDFDLDPIKTAMIFIRPDRKNRSPKENWLKRDKAALSLAQRIVPISIRPGGRLQNLLNEEQSKCSYDFKINYDKPLSGPRHYDIDLTGDFPEWNYLTHWTKTCHGPWPGESRTAFYKRLVSSGDNYPNQAFDTLGNIIDEAKIRGSANKMREGRRAIGFTEANPAQAIGCLMRWRSKYVNWNFEPYGVAIEKETAISLGIRPVIYGNESDYKALSDDDKPYFQSLGRANVDWSREREWRCAGDLDLKKVPSDKILFLAWRQQESLLLAKRGSIRAIALRKNEN